MDWGKEIRLWCKEAEITNENCIEGLVSIYEEVLKLLSKQGHSGFSVSYLNNMFYKAFILGKGTGWTDELVNKDSDGSQKMITENFYEIKNVMDRIDSVSNWKWIILNKLIDNKPLTALTGEPDEWSDITDWGFKGDGKSYQNKRCSAVFKDVLDNGLEIAYWIDDEVYSDDGGLSWYSRGGVLRKQITFPFEIPERKEVYVYNDKYILTDKETIKRVRELKEEERKEDYEIFNSYGILRNNYKSVTFIPDGGSRELKIECRDDGSKYLVTSTGEYVNLSHNVISIFKIEKTKWKLKDRRFY